MTLPGFAYSAVEVDGVAINTATAGSGVPVLLLHGYPQTHLMWRAVAPALAERYTVVATDLRGYGDSAKPAPDDTNRRYAKRAMAADQVAVMRAHGHGTFHVVGHDRGARVAHRLALDHMEAVRSLAVLDIAPTRHVFAHTDQAMATAYFHWFFLATGGGVPERLIGAEPRFWHAAMIERLLGPGASLPADVVEVYAEKFADPAAVSASCADYRSAATVDLEDDDADAAAGRVVGCPTLVLWGAHGFVARAYDPLAVWREYVRDVRGRALPCGHFLPEEAPEEVLADLLAFLG